MKLCVQRKGNTCLFAVFTLSISVSPGWMGAACLASHCLRRRLLWKSLPVTHLLQQAGKSEYHWDSSVEHLWWEAPGQICISMGFLKILAGGWVTQPSLRHPTKRHTPHYPCACGYRICCDSTVCFYRAGRGDITWEFRVGLVRDWSMVRKASRMQMRSNNAVSIWTQQWRWETDVQFIH